ncbi:DUF937 domain-containing protein [Bythopirellula polymerisocia]|uniref:EF-hand domain-containing protein n=1 Tax=Bythopirellula polymerisocia TaxID=2528003 RepID=A0A5C6C9E8_9BACT|nr:DUF937 domain-containing protein [Bythopirellula polymerisocia]TWU20735.1 hypothetical protein Pla144_49020 [Bythopirellula polymerisocia]
MSGLLEALLGGGTHTVEKVSKDTGIDANRAEQAYGAAVGTILRGLEAKSQTKEGADSIWDMLRKQVEQGSIPPDAPTESNDGIQVRDMDPKAVNDILSVIFGEKAPKVEGGFGKVITLDSEATKKVLGKVLPAVLGGIFGAAEKDAEESPRALPRILGGARTEMEEKQPKSRGIFDAILDRDGDGDVDLSDLSQLAGIFASKPR